jgi:bifunctional ADP-heptose synthase (sugar kinase/adenylyltransferase)
MSVMDRRDFLRSGAAAAALATIAAGLVVARFGAAVVTIDELRRAIAAA